MSAATVDRKLPAAYWRLWWAAVADNLGDGAFAAAVPLLAVSVTRDPLLIATVSAATYLPWLLFSLPAGALVDRADRVALMWRSQALQGAVVGTVAVLATLGGVGIVVLAGMGFALGACEVVFANAAQAILPDLVASTQLHAANAAQYSAATVAGEFAGPPLGGLLYGLLHALPFGLDAASFAVSAGLVRTLPRRPSPGERPSVGAAIGEGLRWLRGHRLLRTLALLVGVNTFCFQLGNVTLVLLATETFGLRPGGYGLLLAGAAVGSVLGAAVNGRIVARLGPLPALLASLVTNVVVFEAIGLSPDVVVLGTLLAVNGFVTTMWNVVAVSLRQQVVPVGILGRVNSVYRMLGRGLMPFGALAGGVVARQLGVRAAYPVAGGLRAVALLVALPVLVRAVRSHRPEAVGQTRGA